MTVAIEALSKIIRHTSPAVAPEKLADIANDFVRRVKYWEDMCDEDYEYVKDYGCVEDCGKLILHGTFQVRRGVGRHTREVRELYPYMLI
jgi:hypothetical protein